MLGAAPQAVHAGSHLGHRGTYRLPRLGRSQGVLPTAGYRPSRRRFRSVALDFLSRHDGPAARGGGCDSHRSRRAGCGVLHRRRRDQPDAQCRTALHHAQAAACAQGRRGYHHRPACAPAARGVRHRGLPAIRARSPGRHAHQPDAIPAHPGRRRSDRTRCVGASRAWCHERSARAARRGQRPPVHRARAFPGHRSRHGVATGRQYADSRRHALRCLWPAPGLDHFHPAQPVSRDPGGRARLPAGSGGVAFDLRALGHRRSHFPGHAGPLRAIAPRSNHRAPGAVPRRDPVIQPGTRRGAGRRRRGHRQSHAIAQSAAQRAPLVSRHGQGLFRIACQ